MATRFRSFLPLQGAGLPLQGAGRPLPGADSRTMILTPEEYARTHAQALAESPSECGGVVMERPGAQPERLLLVCRNIQNELHAKDPKRHHRDARTAYYIDPRDLIAMGRHEAQGFRVETIYHSHIDAGASFSPPDRANALINDAPIRRCAPYVVATEFESRVTAVAVFCWDPALRD